MVAVDLGVGSGRVALVGSRSVPGLSVVFFSSSQVAFQRGLQLLEVSVVLVATWLPVMLVAACSCRSFPGVVFDRRAASFLSPWVASLRQRV